MIERYRIDKVSNWKFHCWNEPDHRYWINEKYVGTYDKEKSIEYHKLYDYFAAGVRSVTDRIKIGGPTAAGNTLFIEEFIRHITKEKNYATGEIGSPLDFISMHHYFSSVTTVPIGGKPETLTLLQKLTWYRNILSKYGIGEKEIIVDEWGETTNGYLGTSEIPVFEYRDNEYSAAFVAKVIDNYIKIFHTHGFNVKKMLFCLSGQHDLQKEFEGYRNFFSLNDFPKPVYNAFVLAGKLGEVYLETDFLDDYVGIIPTKDESGGYKIIIYYMDEEFRNQMANRLIRFKLEGIRGQYVLKHYRIDHTMSNSYTKWCECGRIEATNQVQKEAIKSAGQLSLLYPKQRLIIDGTYEESIVMSQNAVSLIELIKMK